MRLILLCFVLFAAGRVAGADGVTYFVNGRGAEAEVSLALEADGKPTLFVRRYSAEQEETLSLYGELTRESEGSYAFESKWSDDAEKEHVISGKVKMDDNTLKLSEMKGTEADGTDASVSNGQYKAATPAVMLRNARERHAEADKQLNAAYQQAKKEAGEAGFAKLRDDQRSWIEYRDEIVQRVTWNAARDLEKAESPDDVNYEARPEYWRMLTSQTVDRTPILKAWSGKSVPPGRAGKYRDSYGGEVTLNEKDGALEFEINVVRTAAFNLGDVDGVAKLTGETAEWTDAPKPEGEKPAVIRFKFNANRSLTVESEDADAYHGHGAHFDGTYFKVAPAAAPKEKPKK